MLESSIVDYVYKIGELPQRPVILLFSQAEEELFQGFRDRYYSISLWHQWKTLKQSLPSDLLELGFADLHLPACTMSYAWLELITELYPRSDHPVIRRFLSPAELWYYLHVLESDFLLPDHGLDGSGIKPTILSKQKEVKELTKFFQALMDDQMPEIIVPKGEKLSDNGWLAEIILTEALRLSEELPNEFDKYCRLYLRRTIKALNQVRNSKNIQYCWIDAVTGRLNRTQKHKKLPKSL
jgi:hypothetical protein